MLITQPYPVPPCGSTLNLEVLADKFNRLCVFDSNKSSNPNRIQTEDISKIIAIGSTKDLTIKHPKNAMSQLQKFVDERKGWIFGYLSYDLKNEIESLKSDNEDGLDFPALLFFSPKVVIQIDYNILSLTYDSDYTSKKEAEEIFELSFSSTPTQKNTGEKNIEIFPKIDKNNYINSVNNLKKHIKKGDIYEINFCMEFFAEKIKLNPFSTFFHLNNISQAPFAAFCKFDSHYVICSSPERYIQKRGTRLISQPIKGTVKRSEDFKMDKQLKQNLKDSEKERSENVMIVDLVRNDLSRIAVPKSVKVEELFGVYTFKQLHQMISTISCEIDEKTSFTDIIKGTFPMGSMTGAPKVSAMKLIEEFENSKRGLYSGAIGYISPNGDFDFNVVIRSILYNSEAKYLSFMVGSAITEKAIPEKEYEECLLKAKALFEAINPKEV